MADLVDRQKIKARFEPWLKVQGYSEGELNMLKAVIYEITIMPSEERHGKWLHKNSTFKNRWLCSECGYTWYFDTKEASYCPHCGARMRGE